MLEEREADRVADATPCVLCVRPLAADRRQRKETQIKGDVDLWREIAKGRSESKRDTETHARLSRAGSSRDVKVRD